MTKTEYRKYIQSEYWQDRRRKFLAELTMVGCADCGMPRWLCPVFYDQDIHVDHKNYQNLGAELDGDLQALCPRCHDVKHHGTSKLPEVIPPECLACGEKMWGNECISCIRDYFSYWEKQSTETVFDLTERLKSQKESLGGGAQA